MKVNVPLLLLFLSCAAARVCADQTPIAPVTGATLGNISGTAPISDLTGGLSALPPSAVMYSPDNASAYVLGPGDTISISVTPQDKYSLATVSIGQDGTFMYPRLGTINANGQTVEQLKDELVQKLTQFCVNPDVTIVVTALRPQPIYVTGGVGAPRILDVRAASTVAKAITLAGGATDQNMLTHVTVFRGQQTLHANVYPILVNGVDNGDNIALQPNDLVVVPVNTQKIAVVGAVDNPGLQPLIQPGGNEGPMRLSDAFAQAGGVTREGARIHEVRLIRAGADGKEVTTIIDYGKYEEFGNVADNPTLQDKDLIVVPDARQQLNVNDLFTSWGVFNILKGL